ncbi:Phosphatidylinositol 3- and 4-kinase family protein [Cryptosporidium felis]|nr:Phosphatidylinositol 3- and 4-kinase family protein [Cryptosporidium felis]
MSCGKYYWVFQGGHEPTLPLIGLSSGPNQKNSIEKLVNCLLENIVLLEDGSKNIISAKNSSLFNLLFFIFPKRNANSIENANVDASELFPLELKFTDTVLEQRVLLKDLIAILRNDQMGVLRQLVELIIKFAPLELGELLLNMEDFQDSVICIYFTIYLSIVLSIHDFGASNDSYFEKSSLDEARQSWLDKFLSQLDCLLGYFVRVSTNRVNKGGDINKDCLLLIFSLILYLVFSLCGAEKDKGIYRSIVIRMLKIQVSNLKFNYWYLKTLLLIIEKIDIDLDISEIALVILQYQKIAAEKFEQEDGLDKSVQMIGFIEIHTMTQFFRRWVKNEMTLKRQLMFAIDRFNRSKSTELIRDLEGYSPERADDYSNMDSISIVFLKITHSFSQGFGVSLKGLKGGRKKESSSNSNLEDVDGLLLLDFLDELLTYGEFQTISFSVLFDSLRLLVTVLTVLVDSSNFENESYDIKGDIIRDDIIINQESRNIRTCWCRDLVERLFFSITKLITWCKSDLRDFNESLNTVSSISSLNSTAKTTKFDISLFLIIWNNYISLVTAREGRYDWSQLEDSIRISLIYLVNKNYKLDILCEITLLMSNFDSSLPVFLDSRYSRVLNLWITLWRSYIDENSGLLTNQGGVESIFTVPNIGCFFEYLAILEEMISQNSTLTNESRGKTTQKIESKVLELTGMISSVLICHKISGSCEKQSALMSILSASENPRIMSEYLYAQVSKSLQFEGAYIYDSLKFFRERWDSSVKIQVFSLLSDLFVSLVKPSLFQFIQCLLGNLTVKGGIFEKSFSLFKVRGMRGVISNEDYEILQQKLTEVISYSKPISEDSPSVLINEIFFGCYSIDLYYTINNIQKGWQSPSLALSPSSPKTFVSKRKHSSLVITDSEDVYSLINKLNPLFDQLVNDIDYLKLFINCVGEINNCYFYFLFGNHHERSAAALKEQILNFSATFGVKFDESLVASMKVENELLLNIQNDSKEELIEERFNYKFYSQVIIRMVYLCTWMIVDNDIESYRSLSHIFAEKILSGLFGLLRERYPEKNEYGSGGDSISLKNRNTYYEDRFNSSLKDYYALEHYSKFMCIIWSILSSLDPNSIFGSYMRISRKKDLSYYQLYSLLAFLMESSDWFICHGYFQYLDLSNLLNQVELMISLSVGASKRQSLAQNSENAASDCSSALHLEILLACLVLKSISIEIPDLEELEPFKKSQSSNFKGNCEQDVQEIRINTFNNKWTLRDAYLNGGRSMINTSSFLSCRVLALLWSFYDNYPSYKDACAKLLQSSVQLTTFLDNLCISLYDRKTWQNIMGNFSGINEQITSIFDNRLLSYSQFIVIEFIWEYYINGNTLLLVEKYFSALTYLIHSSRKIGLFEAWLLLSFWKRYSTRFYKLMMKVNSAWVVNYMMDHLFHYSILVKNKSVGVPNSQSLRIFENIEFENLFSFLLYHYHPQHYHDRMSGKYFWYNASSEQGYLNKINSHSSEMKSLAVNSKYIQGKSSILQFHDYLHYIGHCLPFSVVIYLLSNQFSSDKKKFMTNPHHFHHYFHSSLYTSTLIVWSCVRSLLLLEESDWELLLLQYMEIIKSSKKNNHLVLACLLDMALKSTKFSQILCIYTNNPNSSIMSLLQRCLFKECDSLLSFENSRNGDKRKATKRITRDERAQFEDLRRDGKSGYSNEKKVINGLKSVQDSMEILTERMSSISSLINRGLDSYLQNIGAVPKVSDKRESNYEYKLHSLANVQFSFFYILCRLGEMAKYRYKTETDLGVTSPEDDPSVIIGRLNSREIAQLKSEIAQDLLCRIENIIGRAEYKNVPFLNTSMLKSSHTEERLLSIKRINKLKILQSAKNIPYLLSLQLTGDRGGSSLPGAEPEVGPGLEGGLELTVNLIVKCNDDCRQDVITMQYIHVFQRIFETNNIPVWLYPYRILPMMFEDVNETVIYGGIIEFIEDSISLHEIHELHPEGGLKAYFEATFGNQDGKKTPKGAVEYEQARYNFISSLAGYSIACYILQIKDRHNGNILVTKNGHIIHIDYGFIFDISPGNNLHFERAAFKVTQEMLDLMENQVDLFDDLCLSGFLAVREHADLLLSLTQLLINSGIPCFRGETIKKLKERLLLNCSQQQASNIFSKKIHSAHNHITTKGYDLVQFIQQGIK